MGKLTVVLLTLVAGVALGLAVTGCNVGPSPEELARADAIRQESSAKATAAAIANDRARIDAETAAVAQPAAILGEQIILVGLAAGVGMGALIVLVGLPLAAVVWVMRQSGRVYPNEAGLYPVIVRESRLTGDIVIHDPNRAIGPATIYTGRGPGLLGKGEPAVSHPLPAGAAAHVQVAGQA